MKIAWMRRLGAWLTLRGLFLFLGILAVVMLVWFGGPLLALAGWQPLASPLARTVFLLLLGLAFLGRFFWLKRQQRADNEKVVSEMMAGSDRDEALREEVSTQRERLREALALVRKWKPGRFRSVYELPWYILIGAPGSGKSTALLNSGLEFPLRDEMGIDAVKGVGGTRYCDWWFTNRAVIIDTAGRYTTQESPDRRDARGWNSFLGLLKKYRSRQPVNGVILTVSVADLLEQTPTERALHARALKQRVQELKNRLGVVFPVYLVLTKLDLLEGFTDTFAMLSEQEREEVFGVTFELDAVADQKELPAAFDREIDALLGRLSRFSLHRLQQERTPAAHRSIYQFPKQAALLRAPLWNLVKEVFFPSAYEDLPLLRGIYMVSSEQGAQAYDKVSSLVDKQFGLVTAEAKTSAGQSNDGFFLRQLFDRLIFAEHGLATTEGHRQKRFLWIQRGAFAALGVVCLGLGITWYLSYQWNAQLVDNYRSSLGGLQQQLAQGQDDWVRLEEVLSRAAVLAGNGAAAPLPEGGPRQIGLYQGEALLEAGEGAYSRLLQQRFAAALDDTLKAEISANLHNLEYLYETLKVYLMLGDRQYLNPEQVESWFAFSLSRQLPGELNEAVRDSLGRHLRDYLELEHSLETDQRLVAQARSELTALPLAERAYQRIKLDAAQSRLPDFRLPMVMGSVAELVFARRSGASLREGIPGLYTRNGFQAIFEPGKNQIVGHLLEDSWVYGEGAADLGGLDESQIKAGVEDRYFRDYVHHWQSFLDDLRVLPFSSQQEGIRLANLIAGPEAPIARLQKAVRYNTELSALDTPDPEVEAATEALKEGAARRQRHLGTLLGMAGSNEEPELTPVERAFQSLNQVEEAAFDNLQADAKLIGRYFEERSRNRPGALTTVSRDQFDGAVKGIYNTLQETDSPALSGILGGFVTNARSLVKVSVTRQINEVWNTTVYREYRQAIEGHYPFAAVDSEVGLMDFGNFFGYGGTLHRFFEQHLKAHVDTSRSPWRLTSDVGIGESSLRLFERARRIREAFFSPGSRQPRVSFSLTPVYLDSRISQLMLEMDSQTLVYRHGPARAVSFDWPDEGGARLTRVAFSPADTDRPAIQDSYEGTWSLFRMFRDMGAMSGTERRQDVEIVLDKYLASLELVTDSVKHPFDMALLEDFRLPARL